jgi:formate hydrogenlyase transcriptional activator
MKIKVSKNKFFREATVKICGSLEIETFLYESFVYIKNAINLPVDYVSIVHFTPTRDKLVLLAIASEKGGLMVNDQVRVPENLGKKSVDEVMITDTLDEHPLAGFWVAKGYNNNTAQLSLRLDVKGEMVGSVNFCAEGKSRFTEEQANYISILKKPFAIAVSNAIKFRELSELKENLKEDNRFLQDELRLTSGGEIIGTNMGLKGVMEMIRQVAPLSSPVLLLGETGTGKELISSAIHNLSKRKEGPFIKVNCGAIPINLIDSELFGHEKGAFTGAFSRKRGRFERADKGTLFLDEVGELQPDAQVRFLRVIQEKEIERLGGTGTIKINVRIIAATHQNLEQLVKEGRFREDLYFRLSVFPVAIPPLRDRKSDLAALVQHFIQKKSLEMGINEFPTLAPEAYKQLMAYSWPGNVRELENAIERAIIIGEGKPLNFNELKPIGQTSLQNEKAGNIDYNSKKSNREELALNKIIARHITRVLKITNGKIHGKNGAAELLEINPSTLRNRMAKLGMFNK